MPTIQPQSDGERPRSCCMRGPATAMQTRSRYVITATTPRKIRTLWRNFTELFEVQKACGDNSGVFQKDEGIKTAVRSDKIFRPSPSDGTAIGAEFEAPDAFVERRALAVGEAAHEFFEAAGAGDEFAEIEDFAGGEFFPARADGSGFANATQEDTDVVERKSHFAGEANQEDAVEGFGGVTALAVCARRCGEQADFFVIADGGGVEAGLLGERADFHFVTKPKPQNQE